SQAKMKTLAISKEQDPPLRKVCKVQLKWTCSGWRTIAFHEFSLRFFKNLRVKPLAPYWISMKCKIRCKILMQSKSPVKPTTPLTHTLQRRTSQALCNGPIRKNHLQFPQYQSQTDKRQNRKYQPMTTTIHGMILHPGKPTLNPHRLRIPQTYHS